MVGWQGAVVAVVVGRARDQQAQEEMGGMTTED